MYSIFLVGYAFKIMCYIIILIDSFLFLKDSGSTMHVIYLPLLRHIDQIEKYSWSLTCLSSLYILCVKTERNAHLHLMDAPKHEVGLNCCPYCQSTTTPSHFSTHKSKLITLFHLLTLYIIIFK